MLIVGAGLSGIGAAASCRTRCPDATYAILEARDAIGGTWDLFRYPGVRSDSDMFTLGYPFRPWTEHRRSRTARRSWTTSRETAREYGIDENIRFAPGGRAAWSSGEARWTVRAATTGERS